MGSRSARLRDAGPATPQEQLTRPTRPGKARPMPTEPCHAHGQQLANKINQRPLIAADRMSQTVSASATQGRPVVPSAGCVTGSRVRRTMPDGPLWCSNVATVDEAACPLRGAPNHDPPEGSGPSPHHASSRSEEHTSELQSRENLVCRL